MHLHKQPPLLERCCGNSPCSGTLSHLRQHTLGATATSTKLGCNSRPSKLDPSPMTCVSILSQELGKGAVTACKCLSHRTTKRPLKQKVILQAFQCDQRQSLTGLWRGAVGDGGQFTIRAGLARHRIEWNLLSCTCTHALTRNKLSSKYRELVDTKAARICLKRRSHLLGDKVDMANRLHLCHCADLKLQTSQNAPSSNRKCVYISLLVKVRASPAVLCGSVVTVEFGSCNIGGRASSLFREWPSPPLLICSERPSVPTHPIRLSMFPHIVKSTRRLCTSIYHCQTSLACPACVPAPCSTSK